MFGKIYVLERYLESYTGSKISAVEKTETESRENRDSDFL